MSIAAFFGRQDLAYISIDTEGAERRDARPFVSIDANEPRNAEPFMAFSASMLKVEPLEANTEFEIFERDAGRELAEEANKVTKVLVENEEVEVKETENKEFALDYELDYEEIVVESAAEAPVVAEMLEPEKLDVLLLPAPEVRKLLKVGKQPLLIAAPDELEVAISEILESEKVAEAQHVVYFSDVEMMDGAETITEAEANPMRTEKKHSFIGAKIIAVFMLLFGLTTILFPSLTLNAAKMQIDVNPTNTTPGLSLAISNSGMIVATDPATHKDTGTLGITTAANTLVTSTLDLDVSTTGADGYKLYVTTSGTDKKNDYTNALVNKSNDAKINALSSDTTMSAFPAGYWGYTTASSLQSSTTFKAFPVYDSTDTVKYGGTEIASANTAIAGNDPAGETPLTIGVNADSTLPSGEYTNDLLFTIIANPVTVTYNLSFDGNATGDSSLAGVPSTITESSADVYRDITIPNTKPTRDDFIFAGWAESANTSVAYAPGEDVTLQVTDINSSQTVNKTLYAVWTQKDYLQDFDSENELPNTGDTKTLYDKRDGETYTVKRLPDGNVWMTQNLRYATGASEVSSNTDYGAYYNWSTALNVCPAGWHLPSSAEQVTLDIAYGFSGETRIGVPADVAKYMRTDGNWPGFVAAGYYNDASNEVKYAGTRFAYSSRTPDSNAGRENYMWYTTSSLDDFYPAYSNVKSYGLSVRCVAGEEQKKYLQDFNDAIDLRTVGNSDTYTDKRDGAEYTVKRLPDGKVWMTQHLLYMGTDTPIGNTAITSGSDFSTDANSQVDGQQIAIGISSISSTSKGGAYYGGVESRGVVYNWKAANSVCPSGWHLPSSSEASALDRAYGYSGTNRDSRGTTHESTQVAFSTMDAQINNYMSSTGNWPGWADSDEIYSGNLYANTTAMILWESDGTGQSGSNMYFLHYNRSGSTRLIYPVYRDNPISSYGMMGAAVRCVGDQPNVFYIQDFDESTMLPNAGDLAILTDKRDQKTYTVKRLSDGKVWMTQNLAYATGASSVSSNADYGAYYTWEAAQNVCPIGWHLPNTTEGKTLTDAYGASYGMYGDYYYSTNIYSSFTSSSGVNPGFVVAGTGTASQWGAYWLSEKRTSSDAYIFLMSSSDSRVYPSYSTPITNTTSVRCIADEDARITFDANGGTGTMAMQSFTKGVRQAINANTFIRDGYKFLGWALTSGVTTPKYTDGQQVVLSKATVLYAVWEEDYLQEFDAKTRLQNTGDTAVLMDKRDGSTYAVRRLDDGKVWMTQNLRYTGTTDPGTSTRYSGTFTVGASDSQGSGTITLTNNFGNNYSSSAFAAYRGDVDDGAYYGWTAAAMVCPKGWHLMTSNEINNLDIVYGGTGGTTAVTNSPSYSDLASSSKANITLSGRYSGADFNYDSVKARYWTATDVTGSSGSKAYALAMDKDLGNSVTSNDPNGWKYYGFPIRCVADESKTVSFEANGGTGTMADITVEKGESVTLTNAFTRPAHNFAGWATSATGTAVYTDGQVVTLSEDMILYALWTPLGDLLQDFDQDTELLTVGSTKTLYDERDGKAYTVKRLPDGKVWMTQNLGIVGPMTLTSADSNVTSDFELEASSSATSGWCKISGSNEQSCTNRQQIYYDPSNPSDGALYNWYTATAGVGTYSVTSGSVNADICPKGWHLPTGGSNSEMVALDKAYGYSGSTRTNATQVSNYKSSTGNWPNFMPFKYISAGNGTLETSAIFIQSSTASANNSRYSFYIDSSNSIQPTRSSLKGPQSVRCIANYEEKTVSFNANGGTGTIASQTVVKGQSITLPTTTPTRTDYKFLGWSTSSSATTATYTSGQTITVMDDMPLYAVWESIVAFTSNGLTWTKVLGQASFYNASSLCPSGYRIPTRAQLRTLIGASSDGVWVSNSTVTAIYNTWNQPHMVWSSDAYGSSGAYDLFFQNGQAIITATSTPSAPEPVVCVK